MLLSTHLVTSCWLSCSCWRSATDWLLASSAWASFVWTFSWRAVISMWLSCFSFSLSFSSLEPKHLPEDFLSAEILSIVPCDLGGSNLLEREWGRRGREKVTWCFMPSTITVISGQREREGGGKGQRKRGEGGKREKKTVFCILPACKHTFHA